MSDSATHSDTVEGRTDPPRVRAYSTSTTALLQQCGATVPLWSPTEPNAAGALGIERTTAYELARRNEFPVPVIRVGRSLRVSAAMLLRLLGVEG